MNRKEGIMREYQIKIEPFNFIALQELNIKRKINEHAKATIAMRIKDEWKEQFIGILSKKTWVKVTGLGEQEGNEGVVHTVLFYGLVTDFSFSCNGYETILKLELTSGTVLMDLKPHFRVFQNENAVCAGIHQKLSNTYEGGQVLCVEGDSDKTEGVLIQYKETDWEFLKRIAGRNGRYLVPDALKKGSRYTIGLPGGMKRTVSLDKIKIKFDMAEYMKKSQNGISNLQSEDMMELILTERELFQLGDSISYQGRDYYIWNIATNYDGAECVHTYYFRTKEALEILPLSHDEITGSSFDATITNVQKDKVQIELDKDEWKAADGKKWFLYSTVYSSSDGTGWYCMPEIGDSVRLYVPEKEEESFVISAVHKKTDNVRQNPDYKSFKTKYGKEILFTPDSILMTNNKGMMVEMNDSEGITITSDKDIVIEAEDNLTISSGNASLLIAANDLLQVKQGGTSMTLNGDISFTGGEFRIQ